MENKACLECSVVDTLIMNDIYFVLPIFVELIPDSHNQNEVKKLEI